MKLILSPAKEMNCDALEERDWEVSPAAAKVVEAVRAVPEEDLSRVLGVKGKLLDENKAFIEGWKVAEAAPAIELYNGLAFRWLKQVEGWREGLGVVWGCGAGCLCEAVSLGYVATIARGWKELEGLLENGVGRVVRRK